MFAGCKKVNKAICFRQFNLLDVSTANCSQVASLCYFAKQIGRVCIWKSVYMLLPLFVPPAESNGRHPFGCVWISIMGEVLHISALETENDLPGPSVTTLTQLEICN